MLWLGPITANQLAAGTHCTWIVAQSRADALVSTQLPCGCHMTCPVSLQTQPAAGTSCVSAVPQQSLAQPLAACSLLLLLPPTHSLPSGWLQGRSTCKDPSALSLHHPSHCQTTQNLTSLIHLLLLMLFSFFL